MLHYEDEPLDDALVAWMAEYDFDLARGVLPAIGDENASSPGDPRRGLQDCMRLLRQLLPASGSSAGASNSEAQPTCFGRFQVRRELGRGGFGIVYLADDPLLGRAVALKVPRLDAFLDPQLRGRFLREARAAAQLDHPHLVPIYEVGEVGRVCYIASAYCSGGSLAAWLRAQPGPVPVRTAAALVTCIAQAVQHAHTRGVLHRDIKPANILLVPRSDPEDGPGRWEADLPFVPRLTDFGLAKWREGGDDRTRTGVVLGTPSYMAPEQADGRSAGPAADVYSIGVVLYELLTGRVPFAGDTTLQTLDRLRTAAPGCLRRVRPELPDDLETVCLKCLQESPADRYPSAAGLAADLERFLQGESITTRVRRNWVHAASQRRTVLLAVGLLLLSTVLGMALFLQVRDGASEKLPAGSVPNVSSEPEPSALTGELMVRVWAEVGNKQGLRVDQPGALPVRNKDILRLEAQLSRPAHVYLLWLDSEGVVTPLYPWNEATRIVHKDLRLPPPLRPASSLVFSPGDQKQGWKMAGKSGLETMLLLARRTPLPDNLSLAHAIGKLPPTRLRDPREWAIRGTDARQPLALVNRGGERGPDDEAVAIDDPLLQLLGRLQEHFELMRAVRFAHQEK